MFAARIKARRTRTQAPDVQPATPNRVEGITRLGGLVLARQLGESIVIGASVAVEVVSLKSNWVRLRVVAPRSVSIHRREVFDALRHAASDPLRDSVAFPAPPASSAIAAPRAGEADEPVGSLVLTRRAGQTIMIGDEVILTVVEARPSMVRLRVIAPRSLTVHRREVFEAIRAEVPRREPADG